MSLILKVSYHLTVVSILKYGKVNGGRPAIFHVKVLLHFMIIDFLTLLPFLRIAIDLLLL